MLDLEEREIEKISKKDRMVENFMEELKKVNNNPEFQAYMTYEEDQEKIFNSRIKASEKKGLEQGLKKGIEQGKKENSTEIAKNMKNKNIDIQTISACTGLSIEEIEKI